MRVPSTEVQNNFGKYLNMARDYEEVIVTKNGRDIAKIVPVRGEGWVEDGSARYVAGGKPWVTYEEFLKLTEKSDLRYELIDGEVILLASPNYQHQLIVTEILATFHNWFKGKKCRAITAPFDVTLEKSTDIINVVQPDITVLCDTENIDEKGKYKGIPTLIVEVLSGSTRRKDMLKKTDLYMQTGIKEYWMVETKKREIYIYTFEDYDIKDYRVYTNDSTGKSDVFEGLEIILTELFRLLA